MLSCRYVYKTKCTSCMSILIAFDKCLIWTTYHHRYPISLDICLPKWRRKRCPKMTNCLSVFHISSYLFSTAIIIGILHFEKYRRDHNIITSLHLMFSYFEHVTCIMNCIRLIWSYLLFYLFLPLFLFFLFEKMYIWMLAVVVGYFGNRYFL